MPVFEGKLVGQPDTNQRIVFSGQMINPANQEPNLMERLGGVEAQIQQAKNIQDPTKRVLKQGSLAAQGFGDVSGEVTSFILPDVIEKPLMQGLSAIGRGAYNLPIPFDERSIGQYIGQGYGAVKSAAPESVGMLEDIANIAALALPNTKLGAGLSKAGKKTRGLGRSMAEIEKLSSDKLREQAGKAYQTARQKGGVLKADKVFDFIDRANEVTTEKNVAKATTDLAAKYEPQVSEILKDLDKYIGVDANLNDLQFIDNILGDAVNSQVGMDGKLNNVGRKLSLIQNELRDTIENAGPTDIIGGTEGFEALKEGRKLWSRQAKLRDIEKIIQRSETVDNKETAIRRGFANLYANDKKMRGYTAAEKEAIRKASETGKIGVFRDIARPVTSRLSGIAALGVGSPAAATALNIGGMGTRSLIDAAKDAQAEQIAQLIARGSPVKKPLYEKLAGRGLQAGGYIPTGIGSFIQPAETLMGTQGALINLMNQEEEQ